MKTIEFKQITKEEYDLIKKEIKGVRVIFVGSEKGVKWSELKDFAERSGVGESVNYLGYLSDEEIPGIMRNSRLGVIPSTGSEAVWRVDLEWMACGRPVIASDVGSLSEIIEEGSNGFIIRPGNYRELSAAIVKILKNTKIFNLSYFLNHKFLGLLPITVRPSCQPPLLAGLQLYPFCEHPQHLFLGKPPPIM